MVMVLAMVMTILLVSWYLNLVYRTVECRRVGDYFTTTAGELLAYTRLECSACAHSPPSLVCRRRWSHTPQQPSDS
jgi:hypothetical protein